MRTRFGTTLILLFAVACGSPQKTEESETVQMKENAVKEIEPPDEPIEPADQVAPELPPKEELAVEMFEIAPDRPAEAEDGLRIEMVAGAPDWQFDFIKRGETETVTYSGEPLYIEGVAFGELFVISRLGDTVQVTLRSDAPSQPLPEATAADIARREQESRLGCKGEEQISTPPNGTLVLEVPGAENPSGCRIVIGRYTGEVVDL